MTEIELAAIITRATAVMLGRLMRAGLRRTSIDVDPRVVFVWHHTPDYRLGFVIVVSRKTGRVVRGGATGCGPYQSRRGRALERELAAFTGHVSGHGWFLP